MLRQIHKLFRGFLILLILALLGGLVVLAGLIFRAQGPLHPGDGTLPSTQETQPPATEETQPPTEPPIPLCRFEASDFGYVGDYFTCLTQGCLLGIDVSKYQKEVDWAKVREAGFSFVMIRVGFRGYGKEGCLNPDEMAQKHYEGAKEAGLRVGAYFFSQAINVEEAREEARYALELTKDWKMELPIAYDWEYISETARTANVDGETLTQCAIAFCQEISDVGRYTMIYVSPWMGLYDLTVLPEYPQWLARYTETLDYPYDFDMWQYTSTGRVPGIPGDVDINILFPYDK